ncbi:MAG TPA: hypothetical protein VGX22_10280 [Candidatus Dormibacteraeota bacterium]|nr:hypothetical protein [Candidatus Dormibacteraeota bacterium]
MTGTSQPRASRTVNQLHFEDLEPHRFEDLARQLVYDFRPWIALEATGRLGSDDGFDVRGREMVRAPRELVEQGDEEEDAAGEERTWQIQCKREKEIGPKKVREIVQEAVDAAAVPYGFLLVAACDFSKAARDVFHEETLKLGVQEHHIWGAAEIEDRLFTPHNDHLLFAYFGLSLQARRRSVATAVRSRIVLKRQLDSAIGSVRSDFHKDVLLRDPTDLHYPFTNKIPGFKEQPRWRYTVARSHQPPDHLSFAVARFFAYAADNGAWDAVRSLDDLTVHDLAFVDRQDNHAERMAIYEWWRENVAAENRGFIEVWRRIPYERILAVDELGDAYNEGPHLLIMRTADGKFFEPNTVSMFISSERFHSKNFVVDDANRVSVFPKKFPAWKRKSVEGPTSTVDK